MKEKNKYLEAIWGPFEKDSLIDWLILGIGFAFVIFLIIPAIAGGVI